MVRRGAECTTERQMPRIAIEGLRAIAGDACDTGYREMRDKKGFTSGLQCKHGAEIFLFKGHRPCSGVRGHDDVAAVDGR